jgi:hypothetical protein
VTIQTVFLWAVPVAVIAFALSLFLKQVPLRDAARASATDIGEGFSAPEPLDPERKLEIAIARLMAKEGRSAIPGIRERSGTMLGIGTGWCVAQVHLRRRHSQPTDMVSIARQVMVPSEVLLPAFREAAAAGYVGGDAHSWTMTDVGQREWDRFSGALKDWLSERLEVPLADDRAQIDAALGRLTGRFLDEETTARVRGRVLELATADSGTGANGATTRRG